MTRTRRRQAVASAHPLSTAAGLALLEAGGNAYDAALAVSAALTVVQPHMNGLGSDFFAVVRDGRSVAINASGPAGRRVTPERFRELGLLEIPSRGPLSAVTVPGLVAAWSYLGARSHFGWKEILGPAIRFASRGFPATASLARAARFTSWADPDFRATYGSVVRDRLLRQPQMAKTLTMIARDEGHGFYHGSLAREIGRDLARKGGLLDPEDLDAYRIAVVPPLRVRYRHHSVETNPPPSQGATALVWLGLLGREELTSVSEREFVRILERSMRAAYRFRRQWVGDPEFLPLPRSMLSASAALPRIRSRRASPEGRSDTTAFSVYDGEVGISAIQSNYMGFGAGVSIHGTGINLNNRVEYGY